MGKMCDNVLNFYLALVVARLEGSAGRRPRWLLACTLVLLEQFRPHEALPTLVALESKVVYWTVAEYCQREWKGLRSKK